MEGIHTKILKQAYYLTKNFRYFWSAGLFLVWLTLFRGLFLILNSGYFLENAGMVNWGITESQQVRGNPWIGLVALIVIAVLVIYYFKTKAAVFLAVKKLKDYKSIDKEEIKEMAEPYTVGLLKTGLAFGALILILTSLFASPVAYLSSNDYSSRATMLGLIALFFYIPVFILIYYSSVFTPMFMVMHNMTPMNGFRASMDFIRKHWPLFVLLSIILVIIEIIGLIISVALALVLIWPFVLLSQLFYDMGGQTMLVIVQTLAGIAGFVVFFMSQGLIAVFQRIAWAIAFLEMVRPLKSEEQAEAETVPEIIQ
ncbi:MAG TPA: hypothetical protein VEC17_02050 [Candidatus Binatia bacterium]|nr:hypothetical protein [Candidatus Binatia bacterium]